VYVNFCWESDTRHKFFWFYLDNVEMSSWVHTFDCTLRSASYHDRSVIQMDSGYKRGLQKQTLWNSWSEKKKMISSDLENKWPHYFFLIVSQGFHSLSQAHVEKAWLCGSTRFSVQWVKGNFVINVKWDYGKRK